MLYCLMGGFVSADTDAAWQSMISQPLVACTAAGFLFGNMTLGLTVGLLLQLPYLVEAPIGGSNVSMGNLGAFIAGGVALQLTPLLVGKTSIVLVASLLFGILLSWFATPLLAWLRYVNLLLSKQADRAADEGSMGRISALNYLGVLNSLFFGVLFCGLFLLLGRTVLYEAIALIPERFDSNLFLVKPVLLGAGVGAVARLFVRKRSRKPAIMGVVLASITLLLLTVG